jgi:hypothetical protein
MPKFKINDRVICIKAHPTVPQLVVGREYIVYDINTCCVSTIDVGIFTDNNCSCVMCGKQMSDSIMYFNENRFEKVQTQTKEEVQYVKLDIPVEEPCLN